MSDTHTVHTLMSHVLRYTYAYKYAIRAESNRLSILRKVSFIGSIPKKGKRETELEQLIEKNYRESLEDSKKTNMNYNARTTLKF